MTWHFIPNPPSHRAYARGEALGMDGTTVSVPGFGEAELIVMPWPDENTDWVCDSCNDTIDVLDAYGHPIPIISAGSYALCGPCVARAVEYGDLTPTFGELFPRGGVVACGLPCCRTALGGLEKIGAVT